MIIHCVTDLVLKARDIKIKRHGLSSEGKRSLGKEKDIKINYHGKRYML